MTENQGLTEMPTSSVTFTQALMHYFKNGDNGMPTELKEIKPWIVDKSERAAQIAELESYGYAIHAT